MWESSDFSDLGFNTSHVSINRRICIGYYNVYRCFNTSHVSINRFPCQWLPLFSPVSIHLMFLLIWIVQKYIEKGWKVSIHLMFLLILCQAEYRKGDKPVSIHLMFLLISVGVRPPTRGRRCFNTSHVSINRTWLVQNRNGWIVSIHLMFLLIQRASLCVRPFYRVSIHLMFLLIEKDSDSQQDRRVVSIHLMFLLIKRDEAVQESGWLVSIHLMFLLIIFAARAVSR